MNTNGIPELIRAAGRSRYVTPRMPWWGWILIGFILGMLYVANYASAAHACGYHRHHTIHHWCNRKLSGAWCR